MPNTNDSHGESKVIYEDEDWLIVEPMDYDSFMYYTPDNNRLMWKDVRNGQLFCIIDKDKESNNGDIRTYMIFKDEYSKITYYQWNDGREFTSKRAFLDMIPEDIKPQVIEIIGVGKLGLCLGLNLEYKGYEVIGLQDGMIYSCEVEEDPTISRERKGPAPLLSKIGEKGDCMRGERKEGCSCLFGNPCVDQVIILFLTA